MKTVPLLLALVAVFCLEACTQAPEIETTEQRIFKRAPALVDTAVLATEVLPEAQLKRFEDGNPVDYVGQGGRLIRVLYDLEKDATVVQVTHRGFGGPEGAQRVLDKIQAWIDDTDHVVPKE